MKILVRGEKIITAELKQKLPNADVTEIQDTDFPQIDLSGYDVIFDLSIDEIKVGITKYLKSFSCNPTENTANRLLLKF